MVKPHPQHLQQRPAQLLKLYVTPLQTLAGLKEVILNKRKQNLASARIMRYTAWKVNRFSILPAASEVVMQPI